MSGYNAEEAEGEDRERRASSRISQTVVSTMSCPFSAPNSSAATSPSPSPSSSAAFPPYADDESSLPKPLKASLSDVSDTRLPLVPLFVEPFSSFCSHASPSRILDAIHSTLNQLHIDYTYEANKHKFYVQFLCPRFNWLTIHFHIRLFDGRPAVARAFGSEKLTLAQTTVNSQPSISSTATHAPSHDVDTPHIHVVVEAQRREGCSMGFAKVWSILLDHFHELGIEHGPYIAAACTSWNSHSFAKIPSPLPSIPFCPDKNIYSTTTRTAVIDTNHLNKSQPTTSSIQLPEIDADTETFVHSLLSYPLPHPPFTSSYFNDAKEKPTSDLSRGPNAFPGISIIPHAPQLFGAPLQLNDQSFCSLASLVRVQCEQSSDAIRLLALCMAGDKDNLFDHNREHVPAFVTLLRSCLENDLEQWRDRESINAERVVQITRTLAQLAVQHKDELSRGSLDQLLLAMVSSLVVHPKENEKQNKDVDLVHARISRFSQQALNTLLGSSK